MEKQLQLFIKKAQNEQQMINAVQIQHQGKLVAAYDRLGDKDRLHTFSIAKSFTSIGVGIAIDEGLLTLDEKIAPSFTEDIPANACPYVYEITVRDLLMMSCGLKEPLFFSSHTERYQVKDWLKYFFNSEFTHQPGTTFLYSNFNTYVLSCLIEKKAGETLASYLEPRLFTPLGILNPDWLTCPLGHTTGAYGLMLTSDEMTRFGQMLLDGGIYQGERIVSADYIQEAGKNQFTSSWPNKGYGYHFWVGNDRQSFSATGKYGQLIQVLAAEELVVTVQALAVDDIENFIWKNLVAPLKELLPR